MPKKHHRYAAWAEAGPSMLVTVAAVSTGQTPDRQRGFTRTGKAPGTPRTGNRRITYADARAALGDPSLPRSLDQLAYVERPGVARRLRALEWGYRSIGRALGVAADTAHGWLVKGIRPMVPVLPEPEVDDDLHDLGDEWSDEDQDDDEDPEPASWWDENDDEDEDDAEDGPEPASRARAEPKRAQTFGALTNIVAARARTAGYPIRPDGSIDWPAYNRQQQERTRPAPTEAPAPAPEVLPRAPEVRQSAPTMAPSAGGGGEPGTVDLVLDCGHVERRLPLNGPWAQRGWVACSQCHLAHRRIRRPVR